MIGSVSVAIIGAGPYGLSIAAHLQARGIEFRIFGRPMHSWRASMPPGMFLKSEGFASRLYDPYGRFTLKRFCAEKGIFYGDTTAPVSLETFVHYGLAFQEQFVPHVEEKMLVNLGRSSHDQYILQFDEGETILAARVVTAVGICYFSHLPAGLAHLPPDTFSHSSEHNDLSRFKGRDVSVIGGGAAALDLVASLHDAGAHVRLITRRSGLRFNIPTAQPWWKQWYPMSGLGGGWRYQFYERAPRLFRRLPRELRACVVRTALGPAGGLAVKDRVERAPLLLGHSLRSAEFRDGLVRLRLLCHDGEECTLPTDHVIAATGYRVDLRRLNFLSKSLRPELQSIDFMPVLSSDFQSSLPGLYFVGLSSAHTFGPVMRFLVGARYTARRLTRHLDRAIQQR